ncbi:nucleotidyltransferase family protein [Thermocrispum agreste]|nr:nucleotidyltransferase family protein [Thermocrispum agreste]
MKAFLLAAGLGTRLRPLTDHMPKCLVSVGGVPMLDIWLDALAKAGVDEVLINTHHHAHQVRRHVSARTTGPAVTLTYEPQLLGSAGTLRAHRRFVAGDEMFLAINADNLTTFDIGQLVDAHRAAGASALATLTVFQAADPTQCGTVETHDGVVHSFVEKPAAPRSNLANAGIYAFHPAVLDRIPLGIPADIGHHLLPRLAGRSGRVRAVELDGYFIDIGTPDALQRARREWRGAS